MTDDNGRRTTVTIKAGAGHNVPWLVFNGTPDEIRQDIVTTFGWDAGQAFDVSLAELVLNVSKHWQDVATVADKLDGQAVSGSRPKPIKNADTAASQPLARGSSFGGGDRGMNPPQQQTAQPDATTDLIAQIKGAGSVDRLTELWKANRAAFANSDVKEAATARRKELEP